MLVYMRGWVCVCMCMCVRVQVCFCVLVNLVIESVFVLMRVLVCMSVFLFFFPCVSGCVFMHLPPWSIFSRWAKSHPMFLSMRVYRYEFALVCVCHCVFVCVCLFCLFVSVVYPHGQDGRLERVAHMCFWSPEARWAKFRQNMRL